MIQLKTFPHALSGTLVKNILLYRLKINLILICGEPDKEERPRFPCSHLAGPRVGKIEKKENKKQREI